MEKSAAQWARVAVRPLHHKEAGAVEPEAAGPRALAGGEPIPSALRERLEARGGHRLAEIRIHANDPVSKVAAERAVRAFTIGGDIVFAPGEYLPESPTGQELLAHEVAHVLQQRASPDRSGLRVFQYYGQGPECPSPPTHVRTLDDYIALVERAETAFPGISAVDMITRIRRTKYGTFGFERFVRAPAGPVALTSRGPLTPADIDALTCDIMVTMPSGGSTDPSHLFVALDVTRYPGGSALAPAGLSAQAATTWAGDVGSAYMEYVAQERPSLEAGTGVATMTNYWNELSPYHDLMGDIDGLAMSATTVPTTWSFDESVPLSVNLRNFFHPAAGRGQHRRFTLFASAAGIAWTGRGSSLTITPASRAGIIERQVDLFTQVYLPTLTMPLIHSAGAAPLGPGGGLGSGGLADLFYWREYNRRIPSRSWFIDRFVAFVESGLQRENP